MVSGCCVGAEVQTLRERSSVSRYTYIVYLVNFLCQWDNGIKLTSETIHVTPRVNANMQFFQKICEQWSQKALRIYGDAIGPTLQYSVLVLEHQTLRHYRVSIRLSNSESGDSIR